jgi:hypothetical protein
MSKIETFAISIRAIAALIIAGSVAYAVIVLGQNVRFSAGTFEVILGHALFPSAKFVPEELGENYQVQFWTPSAKTKEAADVRDWEKIDSDDKLDAFADELMKGAISGYRRYEVIGAGLGGRKAGMWWIATLAKNSSVRQILEVYNKFWAPGDDRTYMEVARSKEGYPGWMAAR